MTQEQFLYWLRGFMDGKINPPTTAEWNTLRRNLDMAIPPIREPLVLGKSMEDDGK